MDLNVDWSKVQQLKGRSAKYPIYEPPLDRIPEASGVYIFGRLFGSRFEALYVGKANNIRQRVKGQCNNLKLMHHLKIAHSGKRVVLAGEFVGKPGQQLQKCLMLVEKALIRHFLSEGHDLVNKMGVKLREHKVVSKGKNHKRFVPAEIYLKK